MDTSHGPSRIPTIDDIMDRAATEAFGSPLILNVLRSLVVEAIVATALPDGWVWCSSDYSNWDFRHCSGVKLEVKQSAARQSWRSRSGKPSKCSWDIAPRTGFWEDGIWVERAGRNAEIYVLAYHHVFDDSADHRDVRQWRFFVLLDTLLPGTRRLSLEGAHKLDVPVTYGELARKVEEVRLACLQPDACG